MATGAAIHEVGRYDAVIVVVVMLGVLSTACARGDILLGRAGGAPGAVHTAGSGGVYGAAGDATTEAGAEEPAAGSGGAVAGVAGAGGGGDAGAPGPAGSGAGGAVARAPMVARPSAGCGKDPALTDTEITLYGMRARFIVDLPAAYDVERAYPLIMAFRGSSSDAAEFRAALNLQSITGTEALVVYADCLGGDNCVWEYTRDMPLFDALSDKLKTNFCVDEDRVFAFGDGAGSLFVNLIGCTRGTIVRAIAPMTGAPPPPGPCTGITSVWLMQSTSEPMTLGAGRGNRDHWLVRNGCLLSTVPVEPEPCVRYEGCSDRYPLVYCEHGGADFPSFALRDLWSFFRAL